MVLPWKEARTRYLTDILNKTITRAEPDVGQAIRFCAIPHWFNEEIIAWLRGEGLKSSRRSREILAVLTELNFVGPYQKQGWVYRENVRDLLLGRWWERDSAEFRELSGRAAGYFAQKLGEKEALLARPLSAMRRVLGKVETPTEYKREEYQRELMYHLLVADPRQGFKLFKRMFGRAYRSRQLSTCALLLQLVGEQEDHLSAEDRLEYYQRSLPFKEKAGDEHGMATTFHDLGLMYQYKGKLDKAIEYHEGSLAIVEKIGDEQGMSRVFTSLGDVYHAKGERERAIEYYERSLAIQEKVGDEHGMARTFNSLGSVCRTNGEWERAIKYYERSLALKGKVGDEHGMAATFNNLGRVYQAKGEWERALEYYERSMMVRAKTGDEHGMAVSCNNIAMLYRDQGRLQEALPLFQKSLQIFERIGARSSADTVRGNLEGTKQELEAKTEQG